MIKIEKEFSYPTLAIVAIVAIVALFNLSSTSVITTTDTVISEGEDLVGSAYKMNKEIKSRKSTDNLHFISIPPSSGFDNPNRGWDGMGWWDLNFGFDPGVPVWAATSGYTGQPSLTVTHTATSNSVSIDLFAHDSGTEIFVTIHYRPDWDSGWIKLFDWDFMYCTGDEWDGTDCVSTGIDSGNIFNPGNYQIKVQAYNDWDVYYNGGIGDTSLYVFLQSFS